ncbi:hypothetical protein HYPSUDRAFT_692407 [Hypholoma sublateritium FD-334 SS-4]|uniref:Uncharacterized protein n=1 Tax=Hypholoma sublateritium (strain FD-334 SS-4) TaxID=945553 RepID=A0A0D2Q9F6_HYPSF|nr:hypothetical protein HYPSUDRAFT_692407 [Hypholoma sublateritium FD-334 SS-4]
MSAENTAESVEFGLHIRNLLHNYATTHLTTDYLTYTEDFVSEFVGYLQPVPLQDPYSLVLSVEPFQTLSDLHSLSLLKPYDEAPQTTNEAVAYLKKVMGSAVGKPLTDRIAWIDSYKDVSPLESLIPALTRHARKSTPKLGKKKENQHSAEHFKKLLKEQNILPIVVEPVLEDVLVTDEILNLKCQIQAEDYQAVRTLLQTTTDMLRPQKSYKNKYLDPKYLCEIPLVQPEWPEESFVPIFPRSRLPQSGMKNPQGNLPGLQAFTDLPNFIPDKVYVDDLDEDISRQNLIIVDGWQTIRSSPPSTPASRVSDEEDQIDQLFARSTPDTDPPLAEEIAKSTIDPILMPRSRKIGGSSGITPHILAKHTINTFLESVLDPAKQSTQPLERTSGYERCSSSIASSVAGLPPTNLESIQADVLKLDIRDQDLDSELKRLYAGHGMGNLIMKETLDNEEQIFMEVPILTPPNIHPPNHMHLPVALLDLTVQTGDHENQGVQQTVEKINHPLHRFLKKVKGMKSLALSLSWIPFTVDKKLPSAAELIGVTEIFDEAQLSGEVNQFKLGNLLDSLVLGEEDNPEKRWADFDAGTCDPVQASDGFQILVTRQERRRLAKIEGRLEDELDSGDHAQSDSGSITNKLQKARDSENCVDDDPVSGLDTERPAKRRRLEDADLLQRMQDENALPSSPIRSDDLPGTTADHLGSPAMSESDDKENQPPYNSSSSGIMEERFVNYYLEGDVSSAHDYDAPDVMQLDDHGNFKPLSVASLQPTFNQTVYNEKHSPFGDPVLDDFTLFVDQEEYPDCSVDDLGIHRTRRTLSPERSSYLEVAFDPDIVSRSLGIAAFAQLRDKRISERTYVPVTETAPTPAVDMCQQPQEPPEDIFDQNTIRLPGVVDVAPSKHRYLASLELIQRHALVCALRSDECAVELVERHTLGGVDLIVDPHSAIIFFSLFTLPARCESYVEILVQQSWRYANILIIFEAYPEQNSKKRIKRRIHDTSTASELYAYTPPIVKAIKKFKRSLTIADACGTKCTDVKINYAFADTVISGAQLIRMYGHMAEDKDQTGGAVWGERDWLISDYLEGEQSSLAGLNGLNHFSASIILYQISLQDFINISPQERIDGFAGL